MVLLYIAVLAFLFQVLDVRLQPLTLRFDLIKTRETDAHVIMIHAPRNTNTQSTITKITTETIKR